jgi:Ribosomal protein L2
MGKRIIQQARGHGGPRYQVRKQAFMFRIGYTVGEGQAKVLKLINSSAHSAPLAKIQLGDKIFFNPAFDGMAEGQEITVGGAEVKLGNILALKIFQTQQEFIILKQEWGMAGN